VDSDLSGSGVHLAREAAFGESYSAAQEVRASTVSQIPEDNTPKNSAGTQLKVSKTQQKFALSPVSNFCFFWITAYYDF
jgi:hypothetical protein